MLESLGGPFIPSTIHSFISSSTSVVLSQAHKQFRRGPYSVFGVVTGREDRDDRHLALETQLHNHSELHQ